MSMQTASTVRAASSMAEEYQHAASVLQHAPPVAPQVWLPELKMDCSVALHTKVTTQHGGRQSTCD